MANFFIKRLFLVKGFNLINKTDITSKSLGGDQVISEFTFKNQLLKTPVHLDIGVAPLNIYNVFFIIFSCLFTVLHNKIGIFNLESKLSNLKKPFTTNRVQVIVVLYNGSDYQTIKCHYSVKFTPFKKSTLEEQVEDNMFQLAKSFNLPESYLDRRYLIEKIKIKYIN